MIDRTPRQHATFAHRLADGVLRPESVAVAAAALRDLDVPDTLAWGERVSLRAASLLAAVPPAVAVARRAGRRAGAAFVVSSRASRLAPVLAGIRADGAEPVVVLRGGAVHGDEGEAAFVEQLRDLANRPEVTRLGIRLTDLAARRAVWDHDAAADALVTRLLSTVRDATASGTAVDVIVERFRDLDLGVALVTGLAERAPDADLGIVLPGTLPATVQIVGELSAWARSAGTDPLRVVLTEADLEAERLDAVRHGWPLAVPDGAVARRATLIRTVDAAIAADGVRAEVATSDPAVVAMFADSAVALPFGHPLVPELAAAGRTVREVVHVAGRDGFDAAVAAVAARASVDDVVSTEVHDAAADRAADDGFAPASPRTQDRGDAAPPPGPRIVREQPGPAEGGLTEAVLGIAADRPADPGAVDFGGERFVETAVFSERESDDAPAAGLPGFRNASATDPSTSANRAWVERIRAHLGDPIETRTAPVDGAAAIARARTAAAAWGALPAADRAPVVTGVAHALGAHRDVLIRAVSTATGSLIADADADVDEAVDAAAFAAGAARELDRVGGAVFQPSGVVLVEVGPHAPLADAARAFDAIAAGSAVVLAPVDGASPLVACVVADLVHGAGVAHGLVSVTDASPAALAAHPGIARRVGSPPRRTTMIVAPSADIDLAAADIVASAFGRHGRRVGAVSVILVGAVGRSRSLARALADATRSLRPGLPDDLRADVGPLAAPLPDDALAALTTLGEGEDWLVEPMLQDVASGRLWSPGIRVGVQQDAAVLDVELPFPQLTVLSASTLDQAIELQHAITTGLDAGLHTRDARDLARWLDRTESGSLWVGRALGGARPQRQPRAGGLRADALAAGGPNALVAQGRWRPSVAPAPSPTLHLRGLDSRITTIIEAAQPSLDYESFEWLRRAALGDAVVWDRSFGRVQDVSRLGVERNLFRYRPVGAVVRAAADASWRAVLRTIVAAVRAGAGIEVSVAEGMAGGVRRALGDAGIPVFVETDAEWLDRFAAAQGTAREPRRVRAIGTADGIRAGLAALPVRSWLFEDEVTTAGRLELLPYLAEQSITITAHRHGRPDDWSAPVI